MRSAKYYLEKDMKDKFSALSIDKNCTELHNKSPNIYFTDQSAKIEAKYVHYLGILGHNDVTILFPTGQ